MIATEIKRKINTFEPGKIFATKDFLKLGSRTAIDKSLSRFVQQGEIERVSRGLFIRPKKNHFVGNVPPSVESVLEAIAHKNGEIIQTHGAEAARRLKLSTQMPIQFIFYTNGATRKIKVGNKTIHMIHTSNQRKLQFAGTKIGLAISALWYLGQELVTVDVMQQIKNELNAEEFELLKTANLTDWQINVLKKVEH